MGDKIINLESSFYDYGLLEKKRNFLFNLIILISILLVIYIYYFIGRNYLGFIDDFLISVFNHVKYNTAISNISYLGMFYITFFGGLFFLTIPIEPMFLLAVNKPLNNPFILIIVALTGAVISYSINYILGNKFSNFAKKLISVKQFYKLKAIINKHGGIAILVFNIIGFGSQQITFILGVFRYNRTRLFILAFSGQLIKYFGILAFVYFFDYIKSFFL
ncbi:MAG: DedA family protein [Nanoarchaeota archaeon]